MTSNERRPGNTIHQFSYPRATFFFFHLGRVDIGDLISSLQQPASGAANNAAGSSEGIATRTSPAAATVPADVVNNKKNPRTKAQVRADLAAIARLRLRLFLAPGTFRKLAKEAMLAEGRAFERYYCDGFVIAGPSISAARKSVHLK